MNNRTSSGVFLGLTEIAGYYGGLANGLEELDVRVVQLDLSGHAFAYGGRSRGLASLAGACARHRVRAGSRPTKALWKLLQSILLPAVFVSAVVRCDIFVFGYATTFFSYRELPLLRRLGKRIVYVFHGSDSRAPYVDGAEMDPALGRTYEDCVALTAARKQRLHAIERHATLIVANPLSAHLHERPLLPFLWLGIAAAPAPATGERRGGTVRALHAPSQPYAKGSAEIRAAVERLRARGLDIELDEVTSVANVEVHRRLAACDFVVDQIYSDTPMAGLAVEAAVHGKPAIVGGYGWAELEGEPPPTHLCAPDAVEAAIELLATDGTYRRELGERARAFVLEEWAPRAVAERLFTAVGGGAALADPRRLREHRGAGLSEKAARRLVAGVLDAGGVEALQLADKPELERILVEFARGVDETSSE